MDAAGLIRIFRQRADDTAEPYLWQDVDLFAWATEAEREACVRARLIWDDSSAFLTLPLVPGQVVYAIDQRIDRIDRVTVVQDSGGRPFDLCLTGIDSIHEHSDWHPRVGRPEVAARAGNSLHLWPAPNQTGTFSIACYRHPLAAMEMDSDEPEIAEEHHESLVDWMLYRAYSTKDSETEDQQRAAQALARFTANFGERNSANVIRKHRERRKITTRMAF